MKKFILPVVCLLVLASPTFADTTEGNTSVHVITNTQVEGEGTVSTHVETTVNGKTTIYDSNQSGQHTIDARSDGTIITTDSDASEDATITATPSAKEATVQNKDKEESIKNFFQQIKSFFKNLFHFF